MLKHLKTIFQEVFVEVEVIEDGSALRMACAVLMFEILRADYQVHEAEQAKIRQHIQNAFALDEHDTQVLMQMAELHSENAISLHEVVRTINNEYGIKEKRELLKMLWDVAYADGELDRHEEYAIRKLADLLHISHRDFIQTKHLAMPD